MLLLFSNDSCRNCLINLNNQLVLICAMNYLRLLSQIHVVNVAVRQCCLQATEAFRLVTNFWQIL